MKKIFGMVLVLSVLQFFAAFFPAVSYVQTYAEEGSNAEVSALKEELEEEKESLVGLNDELEFMAEQEVEIKERVDYLKSLAEGLEKDMQKETGSKEAQVEDLDSIKEEMAGETLLLEEIGDEKEAFIELKKETEDIIAKLITQIQKSESIVVASNAQTSEQKPVEAAVPSPVAPKEPNPATKGLKEQLRSAEEALEVEIEALDSLQEEIEILQEEIEELNDEKGDIEASILGLLAQTKQFEAAIAFIENEEKTKSSAETKPSDTTTVKE